MTTRGTGGGRARGFTLLEVMIAVAIIAIALVAVLGAQSRSLSVTDESRFNTTAALLAQAKMAEVEAGGEQALVSRSGDFGENFPEYRWVLSMERVVFQGMEAVSDRFRRIDLTVSYGNTAAYRYHLRWYAFLSQGT
ncbi:MAG: prepilin-type N-terminal cleavage/methylation domain-containing protein [Desulfobacteraceae bacterium]